MPKRFLKRKARNSFEYLGQKGQDKWVIEEALPDLRDGYFVDLAATDGVFMSNTKVLECQLGWTGICIEPNENYFSKLRVNRGCICLPDCIDEKAGRVDFLPKDELGGIVADDTDNNLTLRLDLIEEWRANGQLQNLPARPLVDVLDEHLAPSKIDYFSLDVKGSETRVLRSFPFEKYVFMAMTIERPTPELNDILFRNGYIAVLNHMFDTFYIHESNPNSSAIRREPFEQMPRKDW